MATKISTKKPSAIALQEQFNEFSKAFTGSEFRKLLDAVEDQVTNSEIPDQGKPSALAEMVDINLTDMEQVVNLLLKIQNRCDPNAVTSELQRRKKK